MKKLFLLAVAFTISVILFFTGCSSAKKSQSLPFSHEDSASADTKQWLKDYGFCMCLYYGKQKDTAISHDISFAIIKEISNYQWEEYAKIDSLAKKFALAITPTEIADYANQKPVIFRCLEFQKGKKLDSLVNTLKR